MKHDDERWAPFGVTGNFLEVTAAWLREERKLHSGSHRFFEVAGTLVALSRHEYPLASVAFFHAIPGLERSLRLHYQNDKTLTEQLAAAAADGLIRESMLATSPKFTPRFARTVRNIVGARKPPVEVFVRLVPELRNQYFHGTYLLAPDYLYLTVHLRVVADALSTVRPRDKPL